MKERSARAKISRLDKRIVRLVEKRMQEYEGLSMEEKNELKSKNDIRFEQLMKFANLIGLSNSVAHLICFFLIMYEQFALKKNEYD